MEAKSGESPAQVQRIWAARGLKLHRVETFKLSTDPHFNEKLIDVCGLYLDPPANAIVPSLLLGGVCFAYLAVAPAKLEL